MHGCKANLRGFESVASLTFLNRYSLQTQSLYFEQDGVPRAPDAVPGPHHRCAFLLWGSCTAATRQGSVSSLGLGSSPWPERPCTAEQVRPALSWSDGWLVDLAVTLLGRECSESAQVVAKALQHQRCRMYTCPKNSLAAGDAGMYVPGAAERTITVYTWIQQVWSPCAWHLLRGSCTQVSALREAVADLRSMRKMLLLRCVVSTQAHGTPCPFIELSDVLGAHLCPLPVDTQRPHAVQASSEPSLLPCSNLCQTLPVG